MRTSKFLGLVCAGLVALAMGVPHAGASTLPSPGGLGLPKLLPESSPTDQQKNVNAPLSFLSLYSNNGDVHQSNNFGPSSNGDKGPKQDGNQYGSVEKDHHCNCDQSYGPKHDGDKNRGDNKDGNNCQCDQHRQKHRDDKNRGDNNGSNCQCDQHRQKHRDDKNRGDNNRGDKYQNQGGNSCGCDNQGPKPEGDYGQNKYQGNQDGNSCDCNSPAPKPEDNNGRDKYQGNQGGNSCGCDYQGSQGYQPDNQQGDHPEVKQVNVNAPISILSIDSNNGDVRQANKQGSSSKWSNDGTEQKNVNVPISILSAGSNNGDVHQSNSIGSSSKPDCGCNQQSYGSGGGSYGGGSYGGGNGNPMPPTGGIPVVGSLLGGSSGSGSLLGL